MDRRNPETIGVRRTGWAALDRDPRQDKVEFICPHCGARDQKNARRERALYHFTDGFLQDLQGEVTQCHSCKQYLRPGNFELIGSTNSKKERGAFKGAPFFRFSTI